MATKTQYSHKLAYQGFTLVEMMIALAVSGFLLLGVVGSYSSMQGTMQASQELENAQEVIRYSAQVFTRSLKQSVNPANVLNAGNSLVVSLPANSTSCLGGNPIAPFIETYNFAAPNLTCSIDGAPPTILLTGMTNLVFIPTGQELITIRVSPLVLTQQFPAGSIDIDVALTTRIMTNAP